jgi:hypothetical protein
MTIRPAPETASRGPRAAQRGIAGREGAASRPAAAAERGTRLRTVPLINGARVVAGPGTVDRGPAILLPGSDATSTGLGTPDGIGAF